MKYLVVGLGNIGDEYAHTRHNIGFDVVDYIAAAHEARFKPDRLAFHTEFKSRGRYIHLIKPTTYMNLSGKAVSYWMQYLKVPLDHVLVITDDLALPAGKLRLRAAGKDGGHNGLKNINEVLGTNKYPRLRFGIGDDFPKGRQVDFVLSRWNADEEPLIQEKIKVCKDLLDSLVMSGIARTMNQYNTN